MMIQKHPLTVDVLVGTRPEVIKMAPVVLELRKRPDVQCRLLSTGQHREMLGQALATFGLRPEEDLQVMQPNQDLPGLTALLLERLAEVLRRRLPGILLVQGDTTSALCGALAAFYEKVPLGHVEAGLRTGDFQAPWPEEMNRRLTDAISTWCFAPTDTAKRNLLREGVDENRIWVTGNTVIDALFWVQEKVRKQTPELPRGLSEFVDRHRTILVTAHRRESFGDGFERMCQAMLRITAKFSDVGIVYPVHLNPNVQEPVTRMLGGHERICLVPPLSYEPFVWLMDRSRLILTDSGGVQEEAPSLGKPVLVMRDTTERPEGVEAGTARLVGTCVGTIFEETALLLGDVVEYERRSRITNPYGDGHAAERIVEAIL